MTSGNSQPALLARAADLAVNDWGQTLVVAPHPDDESLGCGGTIALLRQAGVPVQVVFTSDGSMSHPHSQQYPAARLTALRESEARAALQVLGVEEHQIRFMRLPDSQVPATEAAGFADAVHRFEEVLHHTQPAVVLVPWRRDPHKDHRATWQIVDAALHRFDRPVRQLEYLIWLWERGEANEFPQADEGRMWQVNTETAMALKKEAVAQHLSQTTRLINDDPEGFMLSPEVLAHFDRPYELFVEVST